MEDYRYLAAHLDKRVDWTWNTEAVRKGQSRLYFLRKLRSFNVCSKMLVVERRMLQKLLNVIDALLHISCTPYWSECFSWRLLHLITQ